MTLPLFPLNTVLFPGCMLDLQIFEARYLDMISRSMKQGQGFGVVSLIDGAEVGKAAGLFAAIGCEALIRDFEQRPNGLLGIRVEGGRRFRVQRAQVLPDQLTLGEVEWLEDGVEQPLRAEHADLAALLGALSAHPMVAALGMPSEPAGQEALANQLAYLLPLDNQQKLQLLDMPGAEQRLERLQQLLELLQGGSQ
ncbi:ATP-dependent protease [Pseudomonas sp. HMWF032]|uniref:LON peptidase substrate-binding domain-containing protein n=1 Tax=unclassified Pseudomonas TaxID=196821 RepID=UPI000D3BC41F|nr:MULTISPECIES: LON peptidase substrate-binding domain-containing protein [unclassified Pseudomonas]PTS85907.1 ATP-dependent protease [Pseudomonas sp. HMWF032]PTT80567.1 ATP-dependent protease [Pseudomonas sp. HMWF010]WAC45368.1 LON peptidase substrate-binding domain-containing protein [Pseudomonas sp. SL4(2022)]